MSVPGKRHPNGYVERRGKAGQLGRSIHERAKDFPHYATEFGHLEADTVQGKKHQGAVMTLTERQSKVEIVLNVHEKTADAINQHLSVKGGFKLSFYSGLKMYDLVGLRIDRCQAI